MRVLITMLGPSVWAVANAFWSSIRDHGYLPECVYLLCTDKGGNCAVAMQMIAATLEEYDVEPDVRAVEVDEESVLEVRDRVAAILDEESKHGNTVALDVTPGRKGTALGAMLAGGKRYEHIFYLYISSLDNANRPYLMVPAIRQRPHDLKKEAF
ncbi:MAG: hypothetical protein WCK39_07420 [Methanomassiliicoccales archaeon]